VLQLQLHEVPVKSAKLQHDELLMATLVREVLPKATTLYMAGPLQVRCCDARQLEHLASTARSKQLRNKVLNKSMQCYLECRHWTILLGAIVGCIWWYQATKFWAWFD
jgi:hypothetical protein